MDDIGFGAIPLISLDDEVFKLAGQDTGFAKEFNFRVMDMARKKICYRAAPVVNNSADVKFSYDQHVFTDGSLVQDFVNKTNTDPRKVLEIREYLEIPVQVDDPTCALNGKLCILSLAPQSIGRFVVFMAALGAAGVTKQTLGQVLIKASVGPKVTKAVQAFNPWEFTRVA